MIPLRFGRQVLGIGLGIVLLAGCGGQSGVPGTVPQGSASGAHVTHWSWMLQEAKSEDLLYVSVSADSVNVYSYPKGKPEGTLTGFLDPGGLCADQKGDVFITNSGTFQVFEYAHGGTSPIRTLNDPGETPYGCSVDPTTGNLAVTNYCSVSGSGCSGAGSVSIYRNAKGNPKTYTDQGHYLFYCGYDDVGNVFIDGYSRTRKTQSEFAELLNGGNAFKHIHLSERIRGYGGIQWDGKDLALGNGLNVIYGVHILGSRGVVESSTQLLGTKYVDQFWIQGSKVIGPNGRVYGHSSVKFWNYPTGGQPTKSIDGLAGATGATVSLVK